MDYCPKTGAQTLQECLLWVEGLHDALMALYISHSTVDLASCLTVSYRFGMPR